VSGQRPPLRHVLGDYLSLRRALGFQLVNAGRLLGQFVGDLEARGIDTVTTEHALAWATQPAGASAHWWAMRLSVVRGFAAYLHSLDPAAEVIPAGQIRPGACRATPYLYSPGEIGALLTAAGELRPALRAATYQTLIGLLAITGIRVGEAIGLDETDFDAGRELLVVRNAKYGKHRLVPLHPSAVQALARYVGLRRQAHRFPASPALLVSTAGTAWWPGALFLVALPASVVALVALRGREAAHVQAVQDAPDAGDADGDVVVAVQVHGDLAGSEVVVLPQMDDLVDDFGSSGVRAGAGPFGAVAQAVDAFGFVAV
jgi:Phage integrase family